MNYKKLLLVAGSAVLLSACGNLDSGVTKVEEGTKTQAGEVTTGRVDSSVYQGVMTDGKYQTSIARQLTADKMNSGYNQANFENGLLRLSHKTFSPDKYFFQEGQKLDEDTLRNWLGRNSEDNSEGLNPADGGQPIIFQSLLENDFLQEDGKTLGGIALGFAFNSVYYNADGQAVEVSRDAIMANARKTVNAVLARVRQVAGLEKVPVVVGLFEQTGKEDILGGKYIYSAVSENGSTTIDQFEPVNEEYIQLPVMNDANNTASQDGLDNKFVTFQNAVQGFFPNLTGISGKAYYVDGQVNNLTIYIDSKYYSKTEITSFTQYVGKQLQTVFESIPGSVEVQISDVDGQQAFLAKKAEQNEIISYIFN